MFKKEKLIIFTFREKLDLVFCSFNLNFFSPTFTVNNAPLWHPLQQIFKIITIPFISHLQFSFSHLSVRAIKTCWLRDWPAIEENVETSVYTQNTTTTQKETSLYHTWVVIDITFGRLLNRLGERRFCQSFTGDGLLSLLYTAPFGFPCLLAEAQLHWEHLGENIETNIKKISGSKMCCPTEKQTHHRIKILELKDVFTDHFNKTLTSKRTLRDCARFCRAPRLNGSSTCPFWVE